MKQLKRVAVAALAAMVLTVLADAPSASATTIEIGGMTQNRAVTIHASIRAGNTSILRDTIGFSQTTCSESTFHGETERVFSTAGTGAIGGLLRTVSFNRCTVGPAVVHRPGTFSVQWVRGTTNGIVFLSGLEVTEPISGGSIITCTTNNTQIGTLTGVRTGQATLDIRATLSCTGIGTGNWTGTYTVTTPEGFGVEE